MVHKIRSSKIRQHNVLDIIRKPLLAYIVIMAVIGASFGINQSNINHHLQENDYKACIRSMKLANQANVKLLALRQPPLKFTENCAKLKP